MAENERTRANGEATPSPGRFNKFKLQAQQNQPGRSALLEKARRQAAAAARTPDRKGAVAVRAQELQDDIKRQVRVAQGKDEVDANRCQQFCIDGDCHFFGHGVSQSYDEAFKRYMQAAKLGYGPGMGRLGSCFLHGRGVETDENSALYWYKKGADEGDLESMNALGNIYEGGKTKDGVKDLKVAYGYYKKSADGGHTDGLTNLGYMYEKGFGVERDLAKAVECYKTAAAKGYAKAQNNLGSLYYSGMGVEQDYKQAVEYYRKASTQGNASAMNNLAICFEDGLGTRPNLEEAIKLYSRSADLGNVNAENNLGFLLFAREKYVEAARWFRRAADKQNCQAIFNLGRIYEEGLGFKKDPRYAYELYLHAKDLDHPDAEGAAKRVRAELAKASGSGGNVIAEERAQEELSQAMLQIAVLEKQVDSFRDEKQMLHIKISNLEGCLRQLPVPSGTGLSTPANEIEPGPGLSRMPSDVSQGSDTRKEAKILRNKRLLEEKIRAVRNETRIEYVGRMHDLKMELEAKDDMIAALSDVIQKLWLRSKAVEGQLKDYGKEPEIPPESKITSIMGIPTEDLGADTYGEEVDVFSSGGPSSSVF